MRPSTYFIRAGTDGPIKIGKADSVECRLQSLQTAHYEKLVVLAVVDEPERYVQRRFATDRIRGEWFFPSETLLAYIANFPGAREPPKVQLNPMSWNYDRKTQPADRLVSALMEYGALFLPGDLLRMINGSRIGPHDYNRLTKQNAIDMAVLFTARYARLRSHEKMILEAEASVESSSRVIALREMARYASSPAESTFDACRLISDHPHTLLRICPSTSNARFTRTQTDENRVSRHRRRAPWPLVVASQKYRDTPLPPHLADRLRKRLMALCVADRKRLARALGIPLSLENRPLL